MAVINIKHTIGGFDYAGTRDSGASIREAIKKNIDDENSVVLDFFGINGISHSFADEIVGIIVRAYGVNFIKDKLLLNNANEDITNMLNFVIRESKKVPA
jgi:hypothetical protein